MKTPCEGRNLEEKNKLLQDLLNFTIPLTNSNGEHHKYGQHYKDVEHHDQGETFKQQKKKNSDHHSIQKQQVQNNINLL